MLLFGQTHITTSSHTSGFGSGSAVPLYLYLSLLLLLICRERIMLRVMIIMFKFPMCVFFLPVCTDWVCKARTATVIGCGKLCWVGTITSEIIILL